MEVTTRKRLKIKNCWFLGIIFFWLAGWIFGVSPPENEHVKNGRM